GVRACRAHHRSAAHSRRPGAAGRFQTARRARRPGRARSDMRAARGIAAVLFAGARLAAAQLPADSFPAHRLPLDLAGLKPAQFLYYVTLSKEAGGASISLGERTVSVSDGAYASAPAVLLLENRTGDGIPAA